MAGEGGGKRARGREEGLICAPTIILSMPSSSSMASASPTFP